MTPVTFRTGLILLLASSYWIRAIKAFTGLTQHRQLVVASYPQQRLTRAPHAVPKNLHEFDDILQESSDQSQQSNVLHSRRRIVLPNRYDGRTTVLASSSSSAFPGAVTVQEQLTDDSDSDDDPYASAFDGPVGKIQQYQDQTQSNTLESKLKSMDLQDMIITFIIPGIVAFVGARWAFNRVGGKVARNADEILDNFAREMIYYDGDMKEMELCMKDYKTKLVWMGPARSDAMLKRYLESYAKKKTVSPQAIASLSYVFTMFKLSEEKAAKTLVQLCRKMGTDKISSAGKLYFLGSRILKTPEGKEALQPIKALIMSTYRDEAVAESLVETSQHAIAEAAYRSAVLNAGKNQKNLTPGWDMLGLDRGTATRIFDDESKEGFMSDRETMYGGQTRKYDKYGRQLDENGKNSSPEGATEEGRVEESTSNVFECGNCGFTLFIAKGRESKFFGDNFKCPECGAAKEDFITRDEDEDD